MGCLFLLYENELARPETVVKGIIYLSKHLDSFSTATICLNYLQASYMYNVHIIICLVLSNWRMPKEMYLAVD